MAALSVSIMRKTTDHLVGAEEEVAVMVAEVVTHKVATTERAVVGMAPDRTPSPTVEVDTLASTTSRISNSSSNNPRAKEKVHSREEPAKRLVDRKARATSNE